MIQRLQKTFRPILSVPAQVYRLAMKMRRSYWERGIPSLQPVLPKAFTTTCPCVSVGNISWGGTGKSPVVSYLLSWAKKEHLKAVVLTRGYGAKPPHKPYLVQANCNAKQAGDETLMLAQKHPEASVLVDPKRSRAAAFAQAHLSPDIFFMDDGFQHVPLRRQLDLVLLTPEDLDEENWNHVQPAGTWREGQSALNSAHAFLIKLGKADDWEALLPLVQSRLAQFRCPVFSFVLEAQALIPVSNALGMDTSFDPDPARQQPYALVSGVGKPAQVRQTAEHFLGQAPAKYLAYADHHPFSIVDAEEINALNMPVICTHKDAVKLASLNINHLWYLKVEPVFGKYCFFADLPSTFDAWWAQRWQALQTQKV